MVIWLITVGEPLPTDEGNPRIWRTGILAQVLLARGHRVIRWTSTFNHVTRKHRAKCDNSILVTDGYQIKMLHGTGYKRTVSLQRVVDHILIAKKFRKFSETEPPPDIILCSMPTIELSAAAVAYGKERGIPVVMDIRDQWPDIFVGLVPSYVRSAARLVLRPYFQSVRGACRNATAIVGSSPEFVNWGVSLAERGKTDYDKTFFHGYDDKPPEPEALRRAEAFWADLGVTADPGVTTVCFFGKLGGVFDLDTVLNAATELQEKQRRFLFVFCGAADDLSVYRRKSEKCRSLLFPGFVNAAEIWTLMRRSSVGLAPYTKNFPASVPNKPIEYLSAGLPVISTLKGTLEELLRSRCSGFTYRNGDPQALARILCELQDNPERLKEMSRNAVKLFEDLFTARKVYTEMAEHLERMADDFSLKQTKVHGP